jgi:Uma2 family endonuclease
MASPVWEYAGPWTEESWLALGATNERIELFDGSLLVSPAPSPKHQKVSRRLANAFDPAADARGFEVYEAVNLRLRPNRVPIPDVVIVTPIDDQRPIVEASSCLLVCEVVSPNNPASDRVLKMHYYAEAAIPWYLLVEIEPRMVLRLFRADDGRYVEQAVGRTGEQLKLTDPVDVLLDPADLNR